MSFFAAGLKGLWESRRTRGASLPWHELEAEAARQGCSPADIFFDRAGRGDPNGVGLAARSAAHMVATLDDEETHVSERAAWRGYDPLPAPRTG